MDENAIHRVWSPCSSSHASKVTSTKDKENLRRQIVGLVGENDNRKTASINVIEVRRNNCGISSPILPDTFGCTKHCHEVREGQRNDNCDNCGHQRMPSKKTYNDLSKEPSHSNTAVIKRRNTPKAKIVRFRCDKKTSGNNPIITIHDSSKEANNGMHENSPTAGYEIRGNAFEIRKEGLKGLLSHREEFAENINEKRQNSLQASLKIFRRRIKLNQDRFIQPNETTQDDYTLPMRSPVSDVYDIPRETEPQRPLSSVDHMRILRSALHNKHRGVASVERLTDKEEGKETSKKIKCSYRLPENSNWGKEVSFKDIKDDSIPNVKTYVLMEDSRPHSKFSRNSIPPSVTLNEHNLTVHNSITKVSEQKIKLGGNEVGFDPRILHWIDNSAVNVKRNETSSFLVEGKGEFSNSPIKKLPNKKIKSQM